MHLKPTFPAKPTLKSGNLLYSVYLLASQVQPEVFGIPWDNVVSLAANFSILSSVADVLPLMSSLTWYQLAVGCWNIHLWYCDKTWSQFSIFSTLTQIPINVFFHHAADESVFGLCLCVMRSCVVVFCFLFVVRRACAINVNAWRWKEKSVFISHFAPNVFIPSDSVMEIEMPRSLVEPTTGEESKW